MYRMSKAVLVRGAFALQCRLSVPLVTVAVSRCTHCSSHYRTPIVKYGTVQKSNLAKWRQDDVCCRRAIRRWNAETVPFPEMCGTAAAEQKKFIHTLDHTRPCSLATRWRKHKLVTPTIYWWAPPRRPPCSPSPSPTKTPFSLIIHYTSHS